MNSWETQNVIVRKRGVAVVEELACDRIAALPSSGDFRGHRHREGTKL